MKFVLISTEFRRLVRLAFNCHRSISQRGDGRSECGSVEDCAGSHSGQYHPLVEREVEREDVWATGAALSLSSEPSCVPCWNEAAALRCLAASGDSIHGE